MGSLLHDVSYGFRLLLKDRAFAAAAIVALALGAGANTAIFSAVNAIVLRPLPYGTPDRLVMVWGKNLKSGSVKSGLSVPDVNDFREQNSVFEQIATFSYDDFNLSAGDEPEHVPGTMVSANFFSVLGVTPQPGRAFLPEEGEPGAARVVIISNGLWKRRFGASPSIIGQTIPLNGASFQVVGVAPPGFKSPNPEDELWIPMSFDGGDRLRVPSIASAPDLHNRARRFLIGVARLKPRITRDQAQTEMDTVARRLEQQYPNSNIGISVNIISISEEVLGDIHRPLLILLAAVGLVLLIACANVANLLLARAAGRQKEMAIRAALGAGRLRVIRQLLTEALILGFIGGALGLGLAYLAIRLLAALNLANIPRVGEINIDGRVLAFTLLVSLLTSIIFGLAPALQSSKPNLNEALQEGSRGSTGGKGGRRTRSLLVILEVAITQLLLICAGLMIKSFWTLQHVNPGFNPDGVLTMHITLPPSKYAEDYQVAGFFDQVIKGVETLPGVLSVGAINTLPLGTDKITFRFTIDGRPPATPGERLTANFRAISDGYFHAMEIPLLGGREFTEHDRNKSAPVVIINESMARRYWPDEDPVGKRMTIPSAGGVSREIVGIVGDVKHSSLDTESGAEMYVPYLQSPGSFMALVVRASGGPMGLVSAVRGQVLGVDKSQPVYDIRTLNQVVGDSLSQPRLYAVLLGVFGFLALALAVVGVYGVISYGVTQRTHEFGIRLALGARPTDIIKAVVGQAVVLSSIGVAIGLVAALLGTKTLSSLLFGVGARDATAFLAVPVLLIAAALLSCYIPARRAINLDPTTALRHE